MIQIKILDNLSLNCFVKENNFLSQKTTSLPSPSSSIVHSTSVKIFQFVSLFLLKKIADFQTYPLWKFQLVPLYGASTASDL